MKSINNLKINVGIDIAKDKHHATILLSDGSKVLKEFFFSNSQKGFQKLHKNITKYTQDPFQVKIAMKQQLIIMRCWLGG